MTSVLRWEGVATAQAPIVHVDGDAGNLALFRRHKVTPPDGEAVQVPVITGNHLRGRWRRVGERLTRSALAYDGMLTAAAAAILDNGGTMSHTGREPVSGAELRALRGLWPLLSVFGCAAGPGTVEGCLTVGMVYPVVAETEFITGIPSREPADGILQMDTLTHARAGSGHDWPATTTETGREGKPMIFDVEALAPGTRLHVWCQLEQPTAVEHAFFAEVLGEWRAWSGFLGSRTGAGNGRVSVEWLRRPPPPEAGWREAVAGRRDEALAALERLC